MNQPSTAWQTFLAAGRTLGPSPGVREAWHHGRRWYAVWAILLDDARVRERADAVYRSLRDAGIRVRPARQPHVTVFVAGFPALLRSRDDDVGVVTLDRQRRALAGVAPVALEIGGVTSFQTCAVLETSAPDLAAARAALAKEQRELRFAPYVPHVTAAIYDEDRAIRDVVPALEPLRALPPIHARGRIELVVFDAHVKDAPLAAIAADDEPVRP